MWDTVTSYILHKGVDVSTCDVLTFNLRSFRRLVGVVSKNGNRIANDARVLVKDSTSEPFL
jgi:hypothetical protein